MTIISLVLHFLIFQPVAHAEVQISSPYAMVLSGQELETLFSKLSFAGTEAQKLDDFFIEHPFKTHFQNVSLSGHYDAKMQKGASLLEFTMSAKMSDMVLHVGRISTDAVIHKVVGGVNIQIFLKGYCENVNIKSSDSASLSVGIQMNPRATGLEPVLDGIDISKLPQWEIHMGACQGPLGYDKALAAEIKNILSNKVEVQKILASPLALKMKALAASLNNRVFAAQEISLSEAVQVRVVPESLEVGAKGTFILKGMSTAYIESEKDEFVMVEDVAFAAKAGASPSTGFYLSQKWIQRTLLKAQSLGHLGYNFKSSAISQLKSLFSSRLYQFFLWPDLSRFARNVEFWFQLKVNRVEKLSYLYNSGDALWYDVNAKADVRTLAPEKSGYMHYGNFSADFKSRIWIKLHKGVAVVGAYQPKFGLSYLWNTLYVKIFKPSQGISASYFGGKIQSALRDERYTLSLPALDLTESVKMRAEVLTGDADMVVIQYLPVSQ